MNQQQSQLLSQSRQTPTRSVNVRSPSKSGVKSPTYRGDYSQTRNLPSTNPIRAPTPDLMPRHERISSTAVPNGLRFTTKKKQNLSVSPQRGGIRDVDEVTEQFNRILKEKNDQIDQLKRQLLDNQEDGVKRAGRGPSEDQITQLINQLQSLNTELTKSRQNEIKLSSMVQNYENQIAKQNDANQKLSQELKEVGEQNQYLLAQLQGQNPDGRMREIQIKHAEELQKLHNQLREAQLNNDSNQNDQIAQLRKQNLELTHEIERLTGFIKTLQQELQAKGDGNQLNIIIQQRNQELDNWKNKYNLLAEERSRLEEKFVQTTTQIMYLENQVTIWKEHCNKIQQSAPDQDKRLQELQFKIAEYESTINQLALDNQRLNQLIKLKDEETEKVKRANRESNVDQRTLDSLQHENFQLKNDLAGKDTLIIQLTQRIRDFEGNGQKTTQELTQKIIILTNELDNVNSHLKARNQEYEDLYKRYNQLLQQTGEVGQSGEFKYQAQLSKSIQLGQEVEKLAALTRNQADEIRDWKNKYAELESKYNQQIIIINSQTNDAVYRKQIQDLEEQLRRKNAEAAEWHQSFINLQAQKERELNNLMETLKGEIKKSNTNLNLQNDYNKLKEQAQMLANQIEQLNRMNIEKDNEIRLLRNQAGNDAFSREKIISLENKLAQVTSELQNQLNMNQIKENEIQSLRRQLEEARGRFNNEAEGQLIQLRTQIVTLTQLLQQKEDTINDLRNQLADVNDPVKRSKKNDELAGLQNKINELTRDNERLTKQNREQAIALDQLTRDLITLQQQSQNVVEMNRKIEALLYQIEVLEKQLKAVAEERDSFKRQLFEVENLRQRIKELEARELMYQEQIRQLRDQIGQQGEEAIKRAGKDNALNQLQVRINELEQQNQVLRGEIEKLNNILRMKDQDLDALKRESNRKSVVDADKLQLENKILLLTSEIQRLSKALTDKHEEVRQLNMALIERENALQSLPQLQSRIALLQEENNRLNSQIKYLTEENIRKLTDENLALRQRLAELADSERQKNEYEGRIQLLISERERLNGIITTMTQEKLSLQAQLNELAQGDRVRKELEYQIEQLKRDKQRLEEIINQINSENSELRNRLAQLGDMDRVKKELESRIQILGQENERLRNALNTQNEENTKLHLKISELSNLDRLRADLEGRIKMYETDNQRLNEIIRRLTEDNTNLQTRISQLSNIEQVRINLENQINLLVAENKRLNDLVRQKDDELVQIRDIKVKFEVFQNRNFDALARLTVTLVELERVSAESREKSNKIIQLEQRLRDNTLEYQNQALQQKVNLLTEQIERLVRELENARNELIQVSRKCQALEAEKQNWDAQRAQYESTIKYLNAELERLRGDAQDNDAIKRSKKNSEDRIGQLEAENKLLREQLQALRNEKDQLLQQITQLTLSLQQLQDRLKDNTLEFQNRDLQNRLNAKDAELQRAAQELQRLNQYMNELNLEINKLKSENGSLDINKRTLEEQNKQLISRIELLSQELNRLNQIVIELNQKLASSATIHNRYDRLADAYVIQCALGEMLSKRVTELIPLANEIDEHKKRSARQDQDKEALINRIRELEGLLSDKERELMNLRAASGNVNILQLQLQQANQDREGLVNRIRDLENALGERDRQIQELKNANSSVNLLQIQIQQYENTINDLRRRHAEELENQKRQYEGLRQSSVNREINELTMKFNIRISELEREAQKYKNLAEQFENELRAQRQQNSELLQRLMDAENRARDNDEAVKRSRAGQQDVANLQENLRFLGGELEKYKNLLAEEKNKNIELESQKSILAIEIERLNTILKEKLLLLEDLQQRQAEWADAKRIKEEAEYLRQLLNERNSLIENMANQIKDLQGRLDAVADLENKLKMLATEIQTLNFALEQKEKEKQGLVQRYENDIRSLQQRLVELQQTIDQLRAEGAQYSTYKFQLEMLQRENEQLKQRLAQTQEQLNQFNVQNSQLQQKVQQLEFELQQLRAQLEGEREDGKVKRSKNDKEKDDISKVIAALQQEIENLKRQVAERDQKINELSNANFTIQLLQHEKDDLLRKVEALSQALSKISVERDNALQKVIFLSTRVESTDEVIKNLNLQIQVLSQQLQAKDQELRNLLIAFQEVQLKLAQAEDNSRRSSTMASSKFIQEKAQLEAEINRLRNELAISEHKHNLTIEEIKRQMELQLSEELRKQLAAAQAEYERRLNDALNAQQQQFEDDRVKRSKQNQKDQDDLKNQLQLSVQFQVDQKLAEVQARLEAERRRLEEENAVLRARVQQLENQLQHALVNEEEILKFKDLIQQLQMQKLKDINELQQKLEEYRSLHINAGGSLQDAIKTSFQTEIQQLKEKVQQLTQILEVKSKENNELQTSNLNLMRERSDMKRSMTSSNSNIQFQMEVDSLKRQLIQSSDRNQEFETRIKQYENRITQSELQLSQVVTELKQTQDILGIKKMERDNAFNQLEQLKGQTLSMSQALSQGSGESDVHNIQFFKREIENLSIEKEMYKAQSEKNYAELNRKNEDLVKKIEELNNIKFQYQQNNNKIYALEKELLKKLETEEIHIM